MMIRKTVLAAAAVSVAVLLSACDSSEERADKHFQNAVELLDAGDVDRAIVEFRNVFELNANHVEARRLFAQTMLERGNLREAVRNYTFVSERDPNDLESRKVLARIAAELQDWEVFERHVTRAHEVAPDDEEVAFLWLINDYRKAVLDQDGPARRAAVEQLETIKQDRPDDLLLLRVLMDNHLQEREFAAALASADAVLAVKPDDEQVMQLRLALLAELGEDTKVEEQLQANVEANPDDVTAKQTLIRWYLSRGEVDRVEAILRADAYSEDATRDERVAYVAFMAQNRGADPALAEIEGLLALGRDTEVLRSLRAGIDFEMGRREKAIAELEDILSNADASDVARDIRVALARMLAAEGNVVTARQRVEEVLAEDPTHVEALKMRAASLVEQDLPDEAILSLRTALDQSPRDPEIMTLMANAYLRAGSRELAGEMLSLAVDASENGVPQSTLYARFLIDDGKLSTAEQILIDALRVTPNSIPLLVELGRVYLGQEDWARLEQVEGTLARLETDEGTQASNSLRLSRLQAQQKTDEAISLIESVAANSGASAAADVAIVRTHLLNNDLASAETYIDGKLADEPENRVLRSVKAGILASTDRMDESEKIYRDLLSEQPQDENTWRMLYALKQRQGLSDEAMNVLNDGLAAIPDSPNLQWALAGDLERSGDIDSAIAIYEKLYEQNSNSVIVANNLASLITTYKTDEASLERAWAIARRLRGIEQPAFQDTYGWIALRRNQVDEALAHLEPAAAGLPNDPLVQYHLAVAYERAGRLDEALAQFKRAVEVAGPADTRDQIANAREAVVRLEAEQQQKP